MGERRNIVRHDFVLSFQKRRKDEFLHPSMQLFIDREKERQNRGGGPICDDGSGKGRGTVGGPVSLLSATAICLRVGETATAVIWLLLSALLLPRPPPPEYMHELRVNSQVRVGCFPKNH